MNATAARLGMTRTKFVNANGLPATEQVTTARDLARLASAVVRDYPEHAQLWSMLEVRLGKRRLHTHNGILTNYAGADGMKTGFICDSGFNVVASATREGHKLIAVVLGEPTGGERTVRAANLLEHGFNTLKWKALFAPQTLETMPVAEDAKGPMTMRQAVISYECGTGGRRRAVAKTQEEGVRGRLSRKKPASSRRHRPRRPNRHKRPLPPLHSRREPQPSRRSLDNQLELASLVRAASPLRRWLVARRGPILLRRLAFRPWRGRQRLGPSLQVGGNHVGPALRLALGFRPACKSRQCQHGQDADSYSRGDCGLHRTLQSFDVTDPWRLGYATRRRLLACPTNSTYTLFPRIAVFSSPAWSGCTVNRGDRPGPSADMVLASILLPSA